MFLIHRSLRLPSWATRLSAAESVRRGTVRSESGGVPAGVDRGHAKVIMLLLGVALEGPAYFGSYGGEVDVPLSWRGACVSRAGVPAGAGGTVGG